ncbi:MAG TPA: DNRLRE domain-containing protein [Bacteroidota bacterium]|nr:DNRLRE domain-containing protein [Bacteroidota bacterium]
MKFPFFSLSILSIFIFSLMMVGCSDEPNAVGIGLLPNTDFPSIDSTESFITSSSSYLARLSGASTTLLLGRYQNTIEARTLLQFSNIPTDRSHAIIDSAILKLRITYRFKDSTGTLALNIHKLLRSWSENSFTWDSIDASLTNSLPDTIFSTFINPQDSIVQIRIDSIVREWFQSTESTPNGIMISPTNVSNIVIGISTVIISGVDYRPELIIGYHDSSDTASISIRPQQRTFVANLLDSPPLGIITVQAGVAMRGMMTFDISLIPSTASITDASMELELDTNNSLNNSFTNRSLIAHMVLDSSSPPRLSGITAIGTPNDTNRTVFIFDMKNIVQQWATGKQNYGIVLRAYNEFTSLDRFAILSSTSSMRPKLKVTYTLLP